MTAQALISFIDTSQARATGSFLQRFMDAIADSRRSRTEEIVVEFVRACPELKCYLDPSSPVVMRYANEGHVQGNEEFASRTSGQCHYPNSAHPQFWLQRTNVWRKATGQASVKSGKSLCSSDRDPETFVRVTLCEAVHTSPEIMVQHYDAQSRGLVRHA